MERFKRVLKKHLPLLYKGVRYLFRRWLALRGLRFIHYTLVKDYPPDAVFELQKIEAGNFRFRPLISVLVPLYHPPRALLAELIESVFAQTYQNWQLVFAVDGYASETLAEELTLLTNKEERVRWCETKVKRHIAGTTQSAFEHSSGEWLLLLDQDDFLRKDALFRLVERLNKDAELDFIYTDHAEVNEESALVSEVEKPGWDPVLFLHTCYSNHAKFFRSALVRKVGGFRDPYYGAQDIDLICRLLGAGGRVAHVAQKIYYWRLVEGSVSEGISAKPYVLANSIKSYNSYFESQGLPIEVVYPKQIATFGVGAFFWRETQGSGLFKAFSVCTSASLAASLVGESSLQVISPNTPLASLVSAIDPNDVIAIFDFAEVSISPEGIDEVRALLRYQGDLGFISLRERDVESSDPPFLNSEAVRFLPRQIGFLASGSWIANGRLLIVLSQLEPSITLDQIRFCITRLSLRPCALSRALFRKVN